MVDKCEVAIGIVVGFASRPFINRRKIIKHDEGLWDTLLQVFEHVKNMTNRYPNSVDTVGGGLPPDRILTKLHLKILRWLKSVVHRRLVWLYRAGYYNPSGDLNSVIV